MVPAHNYCGPRRGSASAKGCCKLGFETGMHIEEKAIEEMHFQQPSIYTSSFGLTSIAQMITRLVKTWIWQYRDAPSTLGAPQSLIPLCAHPCTAIHFLIALELIILSWWVSVQLHRTCRHTEWDSGASAPAISSCTGCPRHPWCPHKAGEKGHDDTHVPLFGQIEARQKTSMTQMAPDNCILVVEWSLCNHLQRRI